MRTLEVISLLLNSARLNLIYSIFDFALQALLVRAGAFCQYLLVRFRPGPRPADGDLPLVHVNGDGRPGGQGGGGAVLLGLPLSPDADGDDVSDGHVEPDPPSGPEVMYWFLQVLYCTMLSRSTLGLIMMKLIWLFSPP